ncbi:MAG: GNAT family N-acetyltransferase [Lacisediminihabitans sp.]
MEFVVRPATVSDAHAIALVHVVSWQESYSHVLPAEFLANQSVERRAEFWRHNLAEGPGQSWVAELNDEIVGFSSSGPGRDDPPRPLELYSIYQLALAHGSGSGQVLIDAALGERAAFLWVAEDNPRAQSFYRRNGFEPDDARKVDERCENLIEIRMVR